MVVLTVESHIFKCKFYQITASQRGDVSHMQRRKIVGNRESEKKRELGKLCSVSYFCVFLLSHGGKDGRVRFQSQIFTIQPLRNTAGDGEKPFLTNF